MARAPDKRIEQAKALYLKGRKLAEIAHELGLPEGTVRRWKCVHKWDNERSDKKANVRKRGAQPGNKNSAGGPTGNKKAEKYGFFSKYLPEETQEIFYAIESSDPIDLLWHQIQIAYAAIVRAQKIAYVKDQNDKTIEKTEKRNGKIIGERWEVQEAWDKQANFMKAQARAMDSLRGLIKQYDDMLRATGEAATEEQRLRLELLRAKLGNGSGEVKKVTIINDTKRQPDPDQ